VKVNYYDRQLSYRFLLDKYQASEEKNKTISADFG